MLGLRCTGGTLQCHCKYQKYTIHSNIPDPRCKFLPHISSDCICSKCKLEMLSGGRLAIVLGNRVPGQSASTWHCCPNSKYLQYGAAAVTLQHWRLSRQNLWSQIKYPILLLQICDVFAACIVEGSERSEPKNSVSYPYSAVWQLLHNPEPNRQNTRNANKNSIWDVSIIQLVTVTFEKGGGIVWTKVTIWHYKLASFKTPEVAKRAVWRRLLYKNGFFVYSVLLLERPLFCWSFCELEEELQRWRDCWNFSFVRFVFQPILERHMLIM